MLGDHPTIYLVVYTETSTKKPGFPGFLELFWVTRHSCPGDHAAKAKTSSLDAFAFNRFARIRSFALPVAVRISSPCRIQIHPRLNILSNTLRWRCRGSNPGPQRLHLEGITTISLLYDTPIYVSTTARPTTTFNERGNC